MSSDTSEFPLITGLDVARARQRVRDLAAAHGFSLVKQTKLVTATSEIARNAVKYANGGRFHCTTISAPSRIGITVVVDDEGPGIERLDLALSNGWSSGGGLGLGLPGAKRLVDDFALESKVGAGTRVEMTIWK